MDTMANSLKTFRERIALRASELGLRTQQQIATAIGLPQPAVNMYLNGKRAPDLETVEKWAVGLECSPAWLLGYSESEIRLRSSTPRDALEIIADHLECFILPASAPKEIAELLRKAHYPSDWQKVEEALKLALVPGYAEQLLSEDEKESAG